MEIVFANEYISKKIVTNLKLKDQLSCRNICKSLYHSIDSWFWTNILKKWERSLKNEIKSLNQVLDDCDKKCLEIFKYRKESCEKWIHLIKKVIQSSILEDLKDIVKHGIDIKLCQR